LPVSIRKDLLIKYDLRISTESSYESRFREKLKIQQFSISGIVKKFKHLPAKSQGFFQTTRLRLTASPRQAEDR
jgi:hypothetical protein